MKERSKVRVMVYAILLIVCTLVSSICVKASTNGTIKVFDKDNVIDPVEKDYIQEIGQLKVYNLYVIVERDKRSRSQQQVDELAKMYYDLMRNGRKNIILVFSFIDTKHGFYSLYYEDEKISCQDLHGILENANQEHRTEEGVIISSVRRIVFYLADVESQHYQELINEKKQFEWNKLYFQYGFSFFVFCLIVYSFVIRHLTKKVSELQKKLKSVNIKEDCEQTNKKELEELQEWKLLAIKIYPDLEIKMVAEKACKQGELFSKKYSSISTIEEYAEMFKEYDNMSLAEKSYVTINMEAAMNTFDALVREKAERMNESIMKIIELPANSRNYKRFEALRASLDDLPDVVKAKINNRSKSCFYKKWFEARKDYAAEHGHLD